MILIGAKLLKLVISEKKKATKRSNNKYNSICKEVMLLNTTFNNSSVISWQSVVFSANETDRHDITEILLKEALNTINQTFCV